MIELHNGKAEEVLPCLKPGIAHAIITDPPYGTTACKWDSIIPFDVMWDFIRRAIAPRGAVVLFGSQPFTSALVMSNPQWFKYEWVWEKEHGTNFCNTPFQPFKTHEGISVFSSGAASHSKNGHMPYNPQMSEGKPYTLLAGVSSHEYHTASPGYKTVNKGKRYPKSVLRFNRDSGLHPTQKPVALMEYLIRTYTNEGETVLDFAMGSGSTGVAAINTGRNFIGIEKDPEYFKIASERIKNREEELKRSLFFGEEIPEVAAPVITTDKGIEVERTSLFDEPEILCLT